MPSTTAKPATPSLKKYPYKGMGVSENAAVRVVWMVMPQCPVPINPDDPKFDIEVPNCQAGRFRPGWWDECEKLGHRPYVTVIDKIIEEKQYDDDGYEVPGSTRSRRIRKERLNVTQVTHSIRHDSGHEVQNNLARGFKFLPDLGYENLCMMRSCERPAEIKTQYGIFCNERHARLIGADTENEFLYAGDSAADRKEKAKQLAAIDLGQIEAV
jgi:hypothetical protein